jgi:CheY-like chemotaxis protein
MKKKFRHLLLVDDDHTATFLVHLILTEMNIAETITIYNHSLPALDFIRENCLDDKQATADCPDLIFLDINMPGMDGFEFLEAMQTIKLQHLVEDQLIVLTNSDHTKDRSMAEKFGVKGIIEKPLSEEKLKAILGDLNPSTC